MNLLEVRQKFIRLSGRMELATEPPDFETDRGADFFINGGFEDLDADQEMGIGAYYEGSFAVNDYRVLMERCRSIESVWCVNSDGERELDKKTFTYMRERFPLLAGTIASTPAYWSPLPILKDPINRETSANVKHTGVLIMPPTDTAVAIKVYGEFYSKVLVENTDENFWSIRFPDIAVLASLRNLEAFYRNTQGVRDYDEIIRKKLMAHDKSLAAIASALNLEMEG